MKITSKLPTILKKVFGSHTDEITHEWIYYGKSNDGDYYYDKKSITKVSPQIFKVWTKVKYSKVRKSQIIQGIKDNGPKLDYTINLLELDCVNNIYKGLKKVKYNDKGIILYDIDNPNPDIVHIPPGSRGDKLLKIVFGSYCEGNTKERTDRWIYYGRTFDGDYYYDQSSVTNISPQIIQVWEKIKYSEIGKIKLDYFRHNEKIDHSIGLIELDFENNTSKTLKLIGYDSGGNILDGYDDPNPEVKQIELGTMDEKLLKLVRK